MCKCTFPISPGNTKTNKQMQHFCLLVKHIAPNSYFQSTGAKDFNGTTNRGKSGSVTHTQTDRLTHTHEIPPTNLNPQDYHTYIYCSVQVMQEVFFV